VQRSSSIWPSMACKTSKVTDLARRPLDASPCSHQRNPGALESWSPPWSRERAGRGTLINRHSGPFTAHAMSAAGRERGGGRWAASGWGLHLAACLLVCLSACLLARKVCDCPVAVWLLLTQPLCTLCTLCILAHSAARRLACTAA
jgi:hypothetical protein